jgi:hypothetical protein
VNSITIRRALSFAQMCGFRKTMVLHVCARYLSVTKEGKWKTLICGGRKAEYGVLGCVCIGMKYVKDGDVVCWGS